MGCLFAILAVFTPRLAFLFLWLFTPIVSRAFDTFLIPLLGIIFLPFTTLIFALVYNPLVGLTAWDWLWVFLALLLDLSAYGGSAYANKDKIPTGGASSSPAEKKTSEKPKSEE